MRKLVCAVMAGWLLVATLPAAVQSQTIGFKIGPTWSKVDVDDPDAGGISYNTSFGGGGFVRFGAGGLAFQLDVLAVTKGAEVEDPTEGSVHFDLDYLEVPVQLALSLGEGGLSPYLLFGPALGFELACDVDTDATPDDEEIDCDDADFFDRNTFDLGLAGAAGVQIALGAGSLLLEGRYTHGLSNIADVADGEDTDIKNRSFALFAGYSIPLGN